MNQRSRSDLLSELRAAGGEVVAPTKIKCPFHEDNTPSMSTFLGEDGVYRCKCHGCGWKGDVFDVHAKRTGKALGEVLPAEPEKPARIFTTEQVCSGRFWEYHDAQGNLVFVTKRVDRGGKKEFYIYTPSGGGGFAARAPKGQRPIYNLANVQQADEVWVVEGEGCADALNRLGFVATTTSGGSNAVAQTDLTPLKGKALVVWPDKDRPGEKYRDAILKQYPNALLIDPPPNLPEGGDVIDLLRIHRGDDEFNRELIETIRGVARKPETPTRRLIEAAISGKRFSLPMPFPLLGKASQMGLPGTVTLFSAEPNTGKTPMCMAMHTLWFEKGIPSVFAPLEEDDDFYRFRLYGFFSGEEEFHVPEFANRHPQRAREIEEKYRDRVEACMSWVQCFVDPPEVRDLPDWVRDHLKDGVRAITIDPFTRAENESFQSMWGEEKKFVKDVTRLIREYDANLICTTHLKKEDARNFKRGDQTSAAGTAAFQRGFQTQIMLMERSSQERVKRKLDHEYVESSEHIHKVVEVQKARNSARHRGLWLGYRVERYQWQEVGFVIRPEKN